MNVLVKDLSGQTLSLILPTTEKVSDLKQLISSAEDLPIKEIRLIYKDSETSKIYDLKE